MIIGNDEFKRLLLGSKNDKLIRFATIASDYTSGRPTLIFDGETAATIKKYPYLASYEPSANERVMVVSGVVIGRIL